MSSWGRGVTALFLFTLAVGCTKVVQLQPAGVNDESAITPTKPAYKSVMVLPPRGSERGAATELAQLEKELLRRGIRVVSSGVTGRVVVEQTESGRGTEGATHLSDLERALVLAKKSNTEGLLQVSILEWRSGTSYYVKGSDGVFVRVSADDFVAHKGFGKLKVKSPELRFEGKLIDVESGEIVASISLGQAVADVTDRAVELPSNGLETTVDGETARNLISGTLLSSLAEKIARGPERKPATVADAKPEKKEPEQTDAEKLDGKKGDAKKKPASAAPSK